MKKYVSFCLELLAAVFLLLSLYPLMRYGTLAGLQVPQHFTGDGCVNIWSTREIFIYLGLIFMAVYAFMWVCQIHPKMVNIPFSSRMSDLDRASLAISIARCLKLWCMALFAWLSISSYRIALGKADYLNGTFRWILLLGALFHLSCILISRRD